MGATFILSIVLSASAHAQVDQIMSFHACSNPAGSPAANEVFIFADPNFGGACAALFEGFYPNPAPLQPGNFGLTNDTLSSMKVGANVRVRLFNDIVYGGAFQLFPGSGFFSSLPGFDNITTSIRVENNFRSSSCNDLQAGEFAVFRDANFGSDCVVLKYGHSYANPINTGIANDAVSSIKGGPTFLVSGHPDPLCNGVPWRAYLYANGNFGNPAISISSGVSNSFLSTFNDITSAINTSFICRVP
jgi:hypothetical protein